MKLVLPNYYNLNIEKAEKALGKNVEYLGTFCVKNNYKPIAIFYAPSPDLEKGHKHYPGLFIQDDKLMVTGFEYEDIKSDLVQFGVHCLECDDVIYSVNRHDYRSCSCGKNAVDGGKDYFKISFDKDSASTTVLIDFNHQTCEVTSYSHLKFESKPRIKKRKK